MTSPEKFMLMAKERNLFETFFTVINRGMLTSEGTDWKNKRKILSSVFNYEFITSHIPMMIMIADKVFDDFENAHWSKNSEDK
jgi:cytochrome P450